MKRSMLGVLLLSLLMAGNSYGNGYVDFDNPYTGPVIYEQCPAPVVTIATPGAILGALVGTLPGCLGGFLIAAFTGDAELAIMGSCYVGAVAGNAALGGITGAIPWSINWIINGGEGCQERGSK